MGYCGVQSVVRVRVGQSVVKGPRRGSVVAVVLLAEHMHHTGVIGIHIMHACMRQCVCHGCPPARTLLASMVEMYGCPSRARLSDRTLKKSLSGALSASSYDVISTPVRAADRYVD